MWGGWREIWEMKLIAIAWYDYLSYMRAHVCVRASDVGRWNLRIWLVFFLLTTHVENDYGSIFFLFFLFYNATRVSLLSYVEACMYVCMYVFMYVCMYMYNWARTDPLCRNREVDTNSKRFYDDCDAHWYVITCSVYVEEKEERTSLSTYSFLFFLITINYPV